MNRMRSFKSETPCIILYYTEILLRGVSPVQPLDWMNTRWYVSESAFTFDPWRLSPSFIDGIFSGK